MERPKENQTHGLRFSKAKNPKTKCLNAHIQSCQQSYDKMIHTSANTNKKINLMKEIEKDSRPTRTYESIP